MGKFPSFLASLVANVRKSASDQRMNDHRKASKEAAWSPKVYHSPYQGAHHASASEREHPVSARPPLSIAGTGEAERTDGQLANHEALHVSESSHLLIGRGVKLVGEISNCETLVVDGDVEAKNDSRVLKIASNGSFKGTVNVDIAEIHGRFEGELVARQKLVVYATGAVAGEISYGKLVVEEGGRVSGTMKSAAISPQAEMTGASQRTGGEAGALFSKGALR